MESFKKEVEELNLVCKNFDGTPWDLEKIGQRMENFERAEIRINELGEGIKKLHFKTKDGKVKVSFETEWKFVSSSKLPQPIDCVKVSSEGKVNLKETQKILKKLREALAEFC